MEVRRHNVTIGDSSLGKGLFARADLLRSFQGPAFAVPASVQSKSRWTQYRPSARSAESGCRCQERLLLASSESGRARRQKRATTALRNTLAGGSTARVEVNHGTPSAVHRTHARDPSFRRQSSES